MDATKRAIHLAWIAGCLSCFCSQARAYTVVTVSTAAPVGFEQTFIADTTTQYNASVFTNPLFQNTYEIKLFGPNASFNPAPSIEEIFNAGIAISTTTYIYGFADGMSYQQKQSIGMIGLLENLCSYPTNFMLVQTSTGSFDRATCQDTSATYINQLYQLQVSTPIVIPPPVP